MIYTASRLQRESGLPFATSGPIVRRQTALARRQYRRWYVPACIAIIVAMAGASVLSNPWAHSVFRLICPVAMLCVGVTEILARRRAEAAILAVAHAASATAAPAS